jgi:hypothetical protein
MAQLYFFPELPDSDCCSNYFRITDKDVIRNFSKKVKVCGKRIDNNCNNENIESEGFNNYINKIKQYEIARLVREFIWRRFKWKTDDFAEWLDMFSPEIIFFCAGDSSFAYDIVSYIKEKYNAKLVTYITDDYILPRIKLSPFYWLRRSLIFNKLKKTINDSDLFITISKEMQDTYKNIFGKESILAVNMPESYRSSQNVLEKNGKNNCIRFVYTGGLHYNRYKVLNLFGNALAKYNSNNQYSKKAFLEIYCTSEPLKKILNKINVRNGSSYCGSLNKNQLVKVLNSCDMPVHVEAFDKNSIASTRLSISTKIIEYLSLGKCIIAIGPETVSSMKYLSGIAFCIINPHEILEKLQEILSNEEKQKYFAGLALRAYKKNHSNNKTKDMLIQNIFRIYGAS